MTVSDVDLNQYYAAGYTILREGSRKEWQDAQLLPSTLLSLSDHVAHRFHLWWSWDTGFDKETIDDFGIKNAREFAAWAVKITKENNIGFPLVFDGLDQPRQIINRFIPNKQGLHLVGIGLHKDWADYHWLGSGPGFDPEVDETHGIDKMVVQQKPLLPGSVPLGFEVVSIHFGLGCSWLCSQLEVDMNDIFQIRTGEWGLLQTYDDAKRIVDWIDEGETGIRAEPEPYHPWLIVDYPLTE